MTQLLMSAAPTRREDAPTGARWIDVAGMIRQASTSVKLGELLKSGKKDIHLLSREKIDELISRAVRNFVDKSRAAAGAAPASRTGDGTKPQFDDLLTQQRETAQAGDDLALSKVALDAQLQDLRDDLAQQKALADGRLPEDVERAMIEGRFASFYAHLSSMERALETLFSRRLYTYREIQNLLRQATAARKEAALKARTGVFRARAALAGNLSAPKAVVRAEPAQVAEDLRRGNHPFQRMDLDLGRGLDVGTVHVRAAARRKDGGIAHNRQRHAFLDVRDDSFSRRLLAYGIDYVVRGERGYLIGDPAFEFANIFDKTVRRPMKCGTVASDEPDAIHIIDHLVEQTLGPPREAGEICVFSVPGDPVDDDHNFIYHRSSLEKVLMNLGYTPKPMLESHLVVLAELKDQDYTGIGLSFGGGLVHVCVAYKSVPTLAFSVPRGGDWIDGSAASAIGMPAPLVCAIKEGGMDLMDPKGRVQEAIAIYYRDFIRYTLETMKRKLEGSQDKPTFAKPVHLVLAGGTSMVPGFVEMFREEFDKVDFPIDVAEIRMAGNPLSVVAAGCLESALAETRALGEAPIDVPPSVLERAAIGGLSKATGGPAPQLERLPSRAGRAEGAGQSRLLPQ